VVAIFECRNAGEECKTGMIPVEKVMIVVVGSDIRESNNLVVEEEGM